MFLDEEGPAETAIRFTDQFMDAGRDKLDALFGAGYAKENPQALAAYVAACASNLNAFMTAATVVREDYALADALAEMEDEIRPAPAPKPRKGRRS